MGLACSQWHVDERPGLMGKMVAHLGAVCFGPSSFEQPLFLALTRSLLLSLSRWAAVSKFRRRLVGATSGHLLFPPLAGWGAFCSPLESNGPT